MKADESGLSLSGVEFTPSPAARARAVARARGADAPPVSAAADLFGSITDISAADSSFDLEGQGRASLDAILGDEVPAAAPPVASAPILAPAPAPRVRDAELEANADPFAPPPGVRRALADAPAPARPGPSDSLRLDPGESALGFADAAPTREPTPLDLVGIPSGFFDAVDDSRAIDLEAGGQSSLVLEPELPTATAMPSAFDVDMPSVLPSASEPQKAPSAAWLSRPGDVPRRSRSKATTIPPRQMQVIRPKADTMLTRVASDVPRAAPSPPADAAPAPVRPSGRAASASGSFAATVASARRSVRLDFVRPSFPPPRPLLVAPLMLWTAPPRVAPAEAAEPNPREVRAAASAAPLDNASASQTGERPGMASGAEHLAEPVAEPQAPELEAASGSAAGESAGVLVADDRTSASEPEVAASDDDWVDDLRAAVASGAASSVSPAVSTEPT
ncbi:MAG: hypothetical protein H6699_12645, partial [Myxococcales bacterium]|nr:hypothetical protein [Myxococcales bacterium]